MTKEIMNFEFDGNDVRTMQINGEAWFVGKDVATVLGYTRPTKAIHDRVDQEDQKEDIVTISQSSQIRTTQNLLLINESGLYSLILSSKLPSAKRFKHWVTSEVLPAIRKHGAYMTDQKIKEILLNPDTIIKLATELKAEREGRLIAEQRVNELTPKATYYDLVLKNKSLVTITQIANDYGMSGQELNSKLHELKVQYKQGSTWLLYSKYQRTGWTHSDTVMVKRKDGTQKAVLQTKWTQKGRLGLYDLLKNHDILPLIERDDIA